MLYKADYKEERLKRGSFSFMIRKKDHLISSLIEHLTVLSTQAELSQEQLASAVNISRQTYSAIETQKDQCHGLFICL